MVKLGSNSPLRLRSRLKRFGTRERVSPSFCCKLICDCARAMLLPLSESSGWFQTQTDVCKRSNAILVRREKNTHTPYLPSAVPLLVTVHAHFSHHLRIVAGLRLSSAIIKPETGKKRKEHTRTPHLPSAVYYPVTVRGHRGALAAPSGSGAGPIL